MNFRLCNWFLLLSMTNKNLSWTESLSMWASAYLICHKSLAHYKKLIIVYSKCAHSPYLCQTKKIWQEHKKLDSNRLRKEKVFIHKKRLAAALNIFKQRELCCQSFQFIFPRFYIISFFPYQDSTYNMNVPTQFKTDTPIILCPKY